MQSSILVVAFCDPHPRFEVFGDKQHVRLMIATAPALESSEGELLARQFVEQNLPVRLRDLMTPCNCLGGSRIDRVLPSDLHFQNDLLSYVRRGERL